MIRVIPFAIVAIGFFYLELSKDLEPVAKKIFFLLALLMLPFSFYACSQIAIVSANTNLQYICDWGYILSFIFWVILSINEMWDILDSHTKV